MSNRSLRKGWDNDEYKPVSWWYRTRRGNKGLTSLLSLLFFLGFVGFFGYTLLLGLLR